MKLNKFIRQLVKNHTKSYRQITKKRPILSCKCFSMVFYQEAEHTKGQQMNAEPIRNYRKPMKTHFLFCDERAGCTKSRQCKRPRGGGYNRARRGRKDGREATRKLITNYRKPINTYRKPIEKL